MVNADFNLCKICSRTPNNRHAYKHFRIRRRLVRRKLNLGKRFGLTSDAAKTTASLSLCKFRPVFVSNMSSVTSVVFKLSSTTTVLFTVTTSSTSTFDRTPFCATHVTETSSVDCGDRTPLLGNMSYFGLSFLEHILKAMWESVMFCIFSVLDAVRAAGKRNLMGSTLISLLGKVDELIYTNTRSKPSINGNQIDMQPTKFGSN